jgi:hypothetical protein
LTGAGKPGSLAPMQATQIKVGQQYALSTSPRKGIDDLASIRGRRVRVRQMGVQRYNPTGGEGQLGTWKHDGIKVDQWDGQNFINDEAVYKARDFLMPWNEYKAERDRRDEAARIRGEEQAEQARVAHARMERMVASLESFGLTHEQGGGWPGEGHFTVDTIHVALSMDQAEKLLGCISERIYEGIRDAS